MHKTQWEETGAMKVNGEEIHINTSSFSNTGSERNHGQVRTIASGMLVLKVLGLQQMDSYFVVKLRSQEHLPWPRWDRPASWQDSHVPLTSQIRKPGEHAERLQKRQQQNHPSHLCRSPHTPFLWCDIKKSHSMPGAQKSSSIPSLYLYVHFNLEGYLWKEGTVAPPPELSIIFL